MNSLLSASAIYEDPTMVYFDTDAVLLQNREAIVDFWRQSSIDSGAQNISYQIESCFESGGVSVLNMQLSLDVSGSYWGIAKDRIHLTGKQTTCITVVDDLIVHVVDYVEYARVFDVVNELRAAEIHD
ncbi:MAG: hypothetical protein HQ519_00495 [Planctomycetes bacterium]|nr:hypothetical protein [Planctomycetota bacterium]